MSDASTDCCMICTERAAVYSCQGCATVFRKQSALSIVPALASSCSSWLSEARWQLRFLLASFFLPRLKDHLQYPGWKWRVASIRAVSATMGISHSPHRCQTLQVAGDNVELWILLLLPLNAGLSTCITTTLIDVVLGIKPRASCTLHKDSPNWAKFPSP